MNQPVLESPELMAFLDPKKIAAESLAKEKAERPVPAYRPTPERTLEEQVAFDVGKILKERRASGNPVLPSEVALIFATAKERAEASREQKAPTQMPEVKVIPVQRQLEAPRQLTHAA